VRESRNQRVRPLRKSHPLRPKAPHRRQPHHLPRRSLRLAAGRQTLETPGGLLNAYSEFARHDGESGVQATGDSGDPSYIPVLVDFLCFSGLLGEDNRDTIIRNLFNLSGAAPGELTGSARFWDGGPGGLGNIPRSKVQKATQASRSGCSA